MMLRPWPRDVVDSLRLPAEDAAYLVEVGLPVDSDWNLVIEPAVRFHEGYPVVAIDDPVPICVLGGKVFAAERAGYRFVNSNVRAFGACLVIYQDYRRRVRGLGEDQALALIDEIEGAMRATDSSAMSDRETYWSLIVEQMRHGML